MKLRVGFKPIALLREYIQPRLFGVRQVDCVWCGELCR